MLTKTEKPIVRELIEDLRCWQVGSITMNDYFSKRERKGRPLKLKEQRLLYEQVHRSNVIKISYMREHKKLVSVFSLVKSV